MKNLEKYAQDAMTKDVLRKYLKKMGEKSNYISFLNEERANYEELEMLEAPKIEHEVEKKVSYEMVEVGTQRDLVFNEFFDDGD